MRFRIEQRFAAEVAAVGTALSDPNYLSAAMAQLPDLGEPEILHSSTDAGTGRVRLQLAYRFGGRLPRVAARVIDPDKLSWIEDTEIDVRAWTATFRITPTHYASFFACEGTWALEAGSAAKAVAPSTVRRFDGTLTVNSPVPFVGGQVEKAIVSGLRERLEKEPPILERWLARG